MGCYPGGSLIHGDVKISNDELNVVRAGLQIGNGRHRNLFPDVVPGENVPE